ncbi:MAG: helix-turn-helix domain-containing protein [Streptosporangiales bacterium]|nr:helix-turn-helix domain-containing protein [Streptosporangiales bacterium]
MARAVPAVVRAMDLLELFLDGKPELSAREITEILGLPRTTVHELLNTLVGRGYLSNSGTSRGSFRLGVRVFQLGSAYAERLDLAREGRHVAEAVSARCDETVNVAVLDGADVIYIVKVDSSHSVRMVSAVGRRLPAHCSALGKMLLSGLTPDELRARMPSDGELPALTPKSIRSVGKLLPALERARSQGVAFDQNEADPDVACVAAPVYDQAGRMVAAMSISVPTIRWRRRTQAEWARLAAEGAAELSYQLGYARGGSYLAPAATTTNTAGGA